MHRFNSELAKTSYLESREGLSEAGYSLGKT